MKMSHIGTVAVLMVMGFAAFQNCAPPSATVRNDSRPLQLQSLEKLQDELHTLAESDLSCMSDSDCQFVAVGDKACGGPDYHLLVSITNPQYRAVLTLAEEYTHQDKLQTPSDMISNCMLELPGIARCVSRTCVK